MHPNQEKIQLQVTFNKRQVAIAVDSAFKNNQALMVCHSKIGHLMLSTFNYPPCLKLNSIKGR